MSSTTLNQAEPQSALRNLEALLAVAGRPSAASAAPSIVRLSRIEAILASVFEHGLAATEHLLRSGQVPNQIS